MSLLSPWPTPSRIFAHTGSDCSVAPARTDDREHLVSCTTTPCNVCISSDVCRLAILARETYSAYHGIIYGLFVCLFVGKIDKYLTILPFGVQSCGLPDTSV